MTVIGIDPGYEKIGISITEKTKTGQSIKFSECFKTKKTDPQEERILKIGERLSSVIEQYEPDEMAIECLFFSKNKKTALKVSEIKGVCTYLARKNNIDIYEYTPNQIKNSVTGDGRADKKQVIKMVQILTKINKDEKREDDEYDAIAIGITHLANSSLTSVLYKSR